MIVSANLERLLTLRDTVQGAVDTAEENERLTKTVNEQSQIIAALVLDHGGSIKGETWDMVHTTESFYPYSKMLDGYGILIEIENGSACRSS